MFDSLQTKTTLFPVPLRETYTAIFILRILVETSITSLDKFSALFCFIFEKNSFTKRAFQLLILTKFFFSKKRMRLNGKTHYFCSDSATLEIQYGLF